MSFQSPMFIFSSHRKTDALATLIFIFIWERSEGFFLISYLLLALQPTPYFEATNSTLLLHSLLERKRTNFWMRWKLGNFKNHSRILT